MSLNLVGQSISKKLENTVVLDVRTHQEFCTGHLCGAIHVPTPLPPLYSQQIERLREQLQGLVYEYPGQTFSVYCKKGIRARLAVDILKRMGVNAFSLGGVQEPELKSYMKEYFNQVCYCKHQNFFK
jgi:rhodanese-related sulfurtransferase